MSHHDIQVVLLIVAAVVFVVATFATSRFNLVAIGLCAVALAMLAGVV